MDTAPERHNFEKKSPRSPKYARTPVYRTPHPSAWKMLDQVPDSGPAVMSIDNRKLPDFKVLQEIGTGIKFVDASASTSNMRLISEDP